ncbi:MAG TPA: methyltransferase domain-containing protein [Gemmatimonadaceae bacterium]
MTTRQTSAAIQRDPALGRILERYLAKELSGPVALMQLLIETEDFDAVRSLVGELARDPDSAARAKELEELLVANAEGCARIATMLKADVDSPRPAQSVEEGIAFSERLFDWSVQQSEEASVALYSLGNPELLDRATSEIVDQLKAWGTINRNTVLLDLGCGIGRMLSALAPDIKTATGIDVSSRMVAAAKRRCASYSNLTVSKADGRGLGEFPDGSFDVVLAVDSFPYIRQSGYELAKRFFAESHRVLHPGGELVVLNYSYSDDDGADRQEVADFAANHGFNVVVSGERPFKLWDGLAFRLTTRM